MDSFILQSVCFRLFFITWFKLMFGSSMIEKNLEMIYSRSIHYWKREELALFSKIFTSSCQCTIKIDNSQILNVLIPEKICSNNSYKRKVISTFKSDKKQVKRDQVKNSKEKQNVIILREILSLESFFFAWQSFVLRLRFSL